MNENRDRVDVLAFGAHPDDVELAIGGTVRLLVEQGHSVGIVDMSRGELGTRGTPIIRREEAAAAAAVLGARYRRCLDLGDGHILPSDEARRRVVEAIRLARPGLVLAPWIEDRHPDHKWTGVLVQEAAFIAGLTKWDPDVPAHRPRAVLHYPMHTLFEPSLVVDVTGTFEKKREACLCFKSQFHDPGSSDPETYISSQGFWDWWEARARAAGNPIGATFGEAFRLQGPVPVSDPVTQFASYGYYPQTGGVGGDPA